MCISNELMMDGAMCTMAISCVGSLAAFCESLGEGLDNALGAKSTIIDIKLITDRDLKVRCMSFLSHVPMARSLTNTTIHPLWFRQPVAAVSCGHH